MNIYETITRGWTIDPTGLSKEDAIVYLQFASENKNYYKNMRTIYSKFGNDPEIRHSLLRHGFRDPEFLWSLTEEDLKNPHPLVCEEIMIHMSPSEIVQVLQRWKEKVQTAIREKAKAKDKNFEKLINELGLSIDDIRAAKLIDLVIKIRAVRDCSLFDAKKFAEQLKEQLKELEEKGGDKYEQK